MREIKYRAWIESIERLEPVMTLSIFHQKATMETAGLYGFNDIVLMQFTGLHDKNGVEIYEGDILNVPYGRHKYNANDDSYDTKTLDLIPCRIVFQEYGGFVPKFMIGRKTAQKRIGKRQCLWGISSEDYEVIGNIHENKELLK